MHGSARRSVLPCSSPSSHFPFCSTYLNPHHSDEVPGVRVNRHRSNPPHLISLLLDTPLYYSPSRRSLSALNPNNRRSARTVNAFITASAIKCRSQSENRGVFERREQWQTTSVTTRVGRRQSLHRMLVLRAWCHWRPRSLELLAHGKLLQQNQKKTC